MLTPTAVEKIKSLAEEVSQREGCRLYDLEFSSQNKNRILRIFIDSESAPVSIDQCANVSKGLSLLLDVEDLIPGGEYELEVSSPGVERPLREVWHFQAALGRLIKLVTLDPIEGLPGETKALTAEVVKADENQIIVKYQEKELSVPLNNIKRAQTVFEFKNKNNKR